MDMDITIWLRDDTRISPVGDMVGALRIGEGGGHINLHSVLAMDQPAVWRRLRDACEEQIKRLAETKATEDLALANKIVQDDELFPDIPEPLLASHASAAAVIEEEMPKMERIEQTVRIPAAPVDDGDYPF